MRRLEWILAPSQSADGYNAWLSLVNSVRLAPRRESDDALSHGRHAQTDLVASHLSTSTTRQTTTRAKTWAKRCASIVPMVSTSTSTMYAATFLTRRWPIWRASPVLCGAAISQYNNTTPVKGPSKLPVAAGQPRQHDRHGRFGLFWPVSRGGARRRQAEFARRYRHRFCDFSRNAPQALRWRELRQAGADVAEA